MFADPANVANNAVLFVFIWCGCWFVSIMEPLRYFAHHFCFETPTGLGGRLRGMHIGTMFQRDVIAIDHEKVQGVLIAPSR